MQTVQVLLFSARSSVPEIMTLGGRTGGTRTSCFVEEDEDWTCTVEQGSNKYSMEMKNGEFVIRPANPFREQKLYVRRRVR